MNDLGKIKVGQGQSKSIFTTRFLSIDLFHHVCAACSIHEGKGGKLPWTLPGPDWQYATACRYQIMHLATGLVTFYCVSIDAWVCPETSEPEKNEGFRMVLAYPPLPNNPYEPDGNSIFFQLLEYQQQQQTQLIRAPFDPGTLVNHRQKKEDWRAKKSCAKTVSRICS